MTDEELLLALLNSTPTIRAVPVDRLDGEAGRNLARSWSGTGSVSEGASLRVARRALQAVLRESDGMDEALEELTGVLSHASQTPRVTQAGVIWSLQAPEDERLAVRAVLAWSDAAKNLPGRLRACANDECSLFLLDRSRPGTAKWCSMAGCGNRLKARTHARRSRI